MHYELLYSRFISARRGRIFGPSEYRERHHIVPRCEGGSDDPANLIELSARDHLFAHLILAKWKGGKHWGAVVFAVAGVARDKRKPTAQEIRIVSRAKEEYARALRGQPKTREHAAKVGAAFRGRKLSPDHLAKLAAAAQGRTHSEASRQAMRAAWVRRKARQSTTKSAT